MEEWSSTRGPGGLRAPAQPDRGAYYLLLDVIRQDVTEALPGLRIGTILPGWYPGRMTRIHVKVRPTTGSVITSQL